MATRPPGRPRSLPPRKRSGKLATAPRSLLLGTSWRTSVCEMVSGSVSYCRRVPMRNRRSRCAACASVADVLWKKCRPTPLRPFTGAPYPGGKRRAALLRRARAPFHEGRAAARYVGRSSFNASERPQRPQRGLRAGAPAPSCVLLPRPRGRWRTLARSAPRAGDRQRGGGRGHALVPRP